MRGSLIAVMGGAATVGRRAATGCHDMTAGCADTRGRRAGRQADRRGPLSVIMGGVVISGRDGQARLPGVCYRQS